MHTADKVHQLMSLLTSDESTPFDVWLCCHGVMCLWMNEYSVIYWQSVGPDNLAQSSLYTQCTLNIINTVPPRSSSKFNSHLKNTSNQW